MKTIMLFIVLSMFFCTCISCATSPRNKQNNKYKNKLDFITEKDLIIDEKDLIRAKKLDEYKTLEIVPRPMLETLPWEGQMENMTVDSCTITILPEENILPPRNKDLDRAKKIANKLEKNGDLALLFRYLCSTGFVCAQTGHKWVPYRIGEGENLSFSDYHPGVQFRHCTTCLKSQYLKTDDWQDNSNQW